MKNILIMLFIPALVFGQKQEIKWKEYKNTVLHFMMSIPEKSEMIATSKNHYKIILNKNKVSHSLDRHELEIAVIKSDTCCVNAKSYYQDFWNPDINDSIHTLKINKKIVYMQTMTDASMGGRRCRYTFFSTCRAVDKTCFIFSSMIYYQLPYDKIKGKYRNADFDINMELAEVKKIISTLKFM